MQHHNRRLARPLALAATAALGLGGLFAAPSAFAATATDTAPTAGPAYESQAKALLAESSVQAVGRDADGNVVVVKTPDSSSDVQAFDSKYDNVKVETIAAPFSSLASNDVVAGAGYFTPDPSDPTTGASCSIGFTGWSPDGDPALISAGHCTDDGNNTDTYLTLPTSDQAGGAAPNAPVELTAELGTFGFSQYGGPGNTPGAEGDKNSIDVSVIDVSNNDLHLQPAVTSWSKAAADAEDLSSDATPITAVGHAVAGQDVSKSGRTTGLTSGTVHIVDGWAEVSGREVYGFGNFVESDEGDSGGAVFHDGTALGILSGGAPTTNDPDHPYYMWAADLQNDLAHTNGYTIQLAIDAPVMTDPGQSGSVERGAAISGTGPASTTILVTPFGGGGFEIQTDAQGAWSFPAPTDLGNYEFSIQAKNGFNLSETNRYTVKVVAAPLKAPVVTTPADGSTATAPIPTISGTGAPGATVDVSWGRNNSGDSVTATVDSSGNWSVPDVNIGYGTGYSLSATQTIDGETSPAATAAFSVVPAAPEIQSPANGAVFASNAAPTSASGLGVTGATVSVSVNGKVLGTAEVVDGSWTFELGDAVVGGDNTLVVSQAINGATSAAAQSAFNVKVPAAPGGAGSGDGSNLANTGSDITGFGIGAGVLLALGIVLIAVRRRREAL